jgi:hypothetical protein
MTIGRFSTVDLLTDSAPKLRTRTTKGMSRRVQPAAMSFVDGRILAALLRGWAMVNSTYSALNERVGEVGTLQGGAAA